MGHTQCSRSVALWIHIDDKHLFIEFSKRACQIDCGRSFPYPAFLIGNGNESGF